MATLWLSRARFIHTMFQKKHLIFRPHLDLISPVTSRECNATPFPYFAPFAVFSYLYWRGATQSGSATTRPLVMQIQKTSVAFTCDVTAKLVVKWGLEHLQYLGSLTDDVNKSRRSSHKSNLIFCKHCLWRPLCSGGFFHKIDRCWLV